MSSFWEFLLNRSKNIKCLRKNVIFSQLFTKYNEIKFCYLSKGLADNTVISKVNDELWDLDRPLEGDCQLKLLKFDDEEGKYVFWHSTAHLMGEAMELAYGGCLCYGPPIESGFYYDMYLDNKYLIKDPFPKN